MARIRSDRAAWPAILIGAIVLLIALIVFLGVTGGADMQRPAGLDLSPPPLPDVKLPWSPPLPKGSE